MSQQREMAALARRVDERCWLCVKKHKQCSRLYGGQCPEEFRGGQ